MKKVLVIFYSLSGLCLFAQNPLPTISVPTAPTAPTESEANLYLDSTDRIFTVSETVRVILYIQSSFLEILCDDFNNNPALEFLKERNRFPVILADGYSLQKQVSYDLKMHGEKYRVQILHNFLLITRLEDGEIILVGDDGQDSWKLESRNEGNSSNQYLTEDELRDRSKNFPHPTKGEKPPRLPKY